MVNKQKNFDWNFVFPLLHLHWRHISCNHVFFSHEFPSLNGPSFKRIHSSMSHHTEFCTWYTCACIKSHHMSRFPPSLNLGHRSSYSSMMALWALSEWCWVSLMVFYVFVVHFLLCCFQSFLPSLLFLSFFFSTCPLYLSLSFLSLCLDLFPISISSSLFSFLWYSFQSFLFHFTLLLSVSIWLSPPPSPHPSCTLSIP